MRVDVEGARSCIYALDGRALWSEVGNDDIVTSIEMGNGQIHESRCWWSWFVDVFSMFSNIEIGDLCRYK